MSRSSTHFSALQRLLHWLMAISIIAMLRYRQTLD